MKLNLTTLLIGGAVLVGGFFLLKEPISNWMLTNQDIPFVKQLIEAGIPYPYGGASMPTTMPSTAPPGNPITQSNRVTYYNPNNYRANVAYGYGPQSASGTYNSIPFSDY